VKLAVAIPHPSQAGAIQRTDSIDIGLKEEPSFQPVEIPRSATAAAGVHDRSKRVRTLILGVHIVLAHVAVGMIEAESVANFMDRGLQESINGKRLTVIEMDVTVAAVRSGSKAVRKRVGIRKGWNAIN
jgi:hypothetical protein